MPLILPSERKLVKSSGRFVLNRDSPQAVGLVAWYPFIPIASSLIDLAGVGGYDQAAANSPPFSVDKDFADVGDVPSSGTGRWSLSRTPVTSYGCTLTAWFNKDDSTNVGWINVLYNTGDTGQNLSVMARATGEVRARRDGASAAVNADEATGYTVGGWDFVAGIFISSTSHAVKANGRARIAGAATDAGTISLNGMAVAYEPFTTARNHFFGLLGDVRVYNRALTDAELDELWHPHTRFELYHEIGKRAVFLISSGGETPVSLAVQTAIESLQSVSLAVQSAEENLQSLSLGVATAEENLQGVSLAGQSAHENLQALSLGVQTAEENLQGVSLAVETATENLGEIAVSLAVATALESLQSVSLSVPTAEENTQSLSAANQTALENLQSAALAVATAEENLQGVSQPVPTAWENLGEIAVSLAVQTATENLQSLSLAVATALESVETQTPVSLAVQTSRENLQAVSLAGQSALEALGPTLVYYANVDFDLPVPVVNFDLPIPVVDFDM